VVTASDDKTARVWDARTGEPVTPPLPLEGHGHVAAFSPDGRRVLTGGGNAARVWDAATGAFVTPPLPGATGLADAAFSPDGRSVATAGREGVRVWDAATGKERFPPLKHPGLLRAAFSPDGRQILTFGRDRAVRLWSAITGAVRADRSLSRDVETAAVMAFAPDGRYLLTHGMGGGRGCGRWGRMSLTCTRRPHP
jgi:WD40 repeat protein